jgi:hypothetical protein
MLDSGNTSEKGRMKNRESSAERTHDPRDGNDHIGDIWQDVPMDTPCQVQKYP